MILNDPEGALCEEAALKGLDDYTLGILQRLVKEPDLHARRVAATLNAVRSRLTANGERDTPAGSAARQAAGLIALDLHGLSVAEPDAAAGRPSGCPGPRV